MEFAQYVHLFRKWLWLIVVAAFIGGGISFIINTGQPSVYRARTIIAIGRFIEARNPEQSDIRIGIELAQTYAQIARTTDVLEATIEALNLPLSTEELNRLIETEILTGTSLLVVNVNYTDAILAADIANGLAEQLILKSPSNLTPDQLAQIDFANSQISALTAQIAQARTELDLVSSQLENATTQSEITRLTQQRNALVTQINEASATVAQFTDTVSKLQQNTNALDIVERARIPTTPSGPSTIVVTLLGALVGGGLAMGGVFLYEYLDETIRTTEEAAQALALPILGAVMRIGRRADSYPDRLIMNLPSMSPIAEAYRTVRTNLLFGSAQSDTSIYVVTSAGPEEGKSVTTANLAISMAMAGLQVLLIDADLRRPRIHEIFGLDNNIGLTTLLSAEPRELNGNGHSRRLPASLMDCMQSTALPKLWVITSGFTPANPTEILGSTLLKRWIEIFRASSDIDVVLLDTPPALVVADSSVLAATADAGVILVVDCGHTRRGAAQKVKEQFQQLGVELKGIVVNRVNPRDQTYDYGYGYGYYYAPEPAGEKQGGLRRYFGSREKQP
ncbi:MAG TPA: polysaccharide biosynthesis tyrosine autokinase [Spirillospora sp.]|nr:polysaccharide biosynthesis tyrosine autokinase [Spirillospora sp.]